MADGLVLEVPESVAAGQTVALLVKGPAADVAIAWAAATPGAGATSSVLVPAGRAALFTPDTAGLWTVTATVDGGTPQVLDAALVVRAVTPRVVGKPEALPFEPTVLDATTSDGPEGHGYRWTLQPPAGSTPLALRAW